MDYGKTPALLPATGGGFLAATLTNQVLIIGLVFLGVFLLATGIRLIWRRGKNIGQ